MTIELRGVITVYVKMGSLYLQLFLILSSISNLVLAQEVRHSILTVDGTKAVAETDDNYICATLDWWPHDKCNYNRCPWGYSSVINLNLSNPSLGKAIGAFKSLRIRIGGSLQDRVVYDVGYLRYPCSQFQKMEGGLFGFTKGCLHMKRWDELNDLFSKTGVMVTFGLNALYGRHRLSQYEWEGDWDSSNAQSLITYTVAKGYRVDSWEFGNELSGSGIGARIAVEQYAKDLIALKAIIDRLYKGSRSKPLLVAPGGFYDREWYAKLLEDSGSGVINVMTHHIYNLGAGVDTHLSSKILNPNYLGRVSETFGELEATIRRHGPWASAWVGESGGAFNSGGHHVSDTFINSFWYLDQLGMAAKYNTKVYCRQSLIGGYYGLLNATTATPNPDYYSALLWHQLMGKVVLAVDSDAPPSLRTYAHCSKGRAGITLLLINLSNSTKFILSTHQSVKSMHPEDQTTNKATIIISGFKRTVSFVGNEPSDSALFREEYHLTPKDGYLHSQTVLLNGNPLVLTKDGSIPILKPAQVNINSLVTIAPRSIAFIVFPKFDAPVCAN